MVNVKCRMFDVGCAIGVVWVVRLGVCGLGDWGCVDCVDCVVWVLCLTFS